jgi:hypothetical protein
MPLIASTPSRSRPEPGRCRGESEDGHRKPGVVGDEERGEYSGAVIRVGGGDRERSAAAEDRAAARSGDDSADEEQCEARRPVSLWLGHSLLVTEPGS